MDDSKIGYISPRDFDAVIKKLRTFFVKKGFIEVHTQSRINILSSCEDYKNLGTFNYVGRVWPLKQSGQMDLEEELLKDPTLPGLFCVTTSYRNEPRPVKGRHNLSFPLFEVEIHGDMEALIKLQMELCEFLGFPKPKGSDTYPRGKYDDIAKKYEVKTLEHEHEEQLKKDYGPVFFLTDFPNHTSPFWNMRQHKNGTHAKKVDVIINGMETLGSAERSCSPKEMRAQFETIDGGNYANTLYSQFTKKRVDDELDEYLSNKFFVRSGFGLGVTRLISAMKAYNLL